MEKLQRIYNGTKQQQQHELNPTKTAINLTDKALPPDVISILKKRSDFVVIPNRIFIEETSASGGTTIRPPAANPIDEDSSRRCTYSTHTQITNMRTPTPTPKQLKQYELLTIT